MTGEKITKRSMRADGRRSRSQLIAAATEIIERDGATASLEEIARVAGVGSATLHRHFPTRWSLLQAIFEERVRALDDRSLSLTAADGVSPEVALRDWLEALITTLAATRGLADALQPPEQVVDENRDDCHEIVTAAGLRLLREAQGAGAIDDAVRIADVLMFATAIGAVSDEDARSRMSRIFLLGLATPS